MYVIRYLKEFSTASGVELKLIVRDGVYMVGGNGAMEVVESYKEGLVLFMETLSGLIGEGDYLEGRFITRTDLWRILHDGI